MRTYASRTLPTWDNQRVLYTSRNLGLNYYNMNFHDGTHPITWLQTYSTSKATADLDLLQSCGVKIIRVFATLESLMAYSNGAFAFNTTYRDNLSDFLTKANARSITCHLVLSRGETPSEPSSLDGYTRWDLVKTSDGRSAYRDAYIAYVNYFSTFRNIGFYELCNEPYSCASGFSAYAVSQGVTQDETLTWLRSCYQAVKAITSIPVGISEYEEEEQEAYQRFSNATNRRTYIDPVSDVYSMHIYRPDKTYMADFRSLTTKPKWLTEFGHLNYSDPTASSHPLAANYELYTEFYNPPAVVSLAEKALNAGFELVMPWSFSDNVSVATHEADLSHTAGPILRWIRNNLTVNRTLTTRSLA